METSAPGSLRGAIITGALGFGIVSLCVFATVAFGERWMYSHLGLIGSYLTWTILFILLGGTVLGSLVRGRWKLPKFYLLFGLAFLVYAVGWTGAYFSLRGKPGEWAGSVIGSLLMGSVLAAGFGVLQSAIKLAFVLFVANSAGYFLGSLLNDFAGGRIGMLLWGLIYGVCLGGGLGAAIYLGQAKPNA
jgi:hypothetical protein